jgi:TonB family protein
MKRLLKILSPKSSSGSFLYSVVAHGLVYAGLIVAFQMGFGERKPPADDYVDMSYQTFDEPPQIAQQEQRVRKSPEPETKPEVKAPPDNSPKELQDDKGEVAGTQEAKKETNIGSDQNGNATATPYYKIKPKYPQAALVAGTEGWVLLQIDVKEDGSVENVRVVDGEQRNMFGPEAKRAVAQWKYRPFVDASGRPIRKADHPVRVDFKLAEYEAGS